MFLCFGGTFLLLRGLVIADRFAGKTNDYINICMCMYALFFILLGSKL